MTDLTININEKTLKKFRKVLERVWSKETAYPPSLKSGRKCKSRGQCYVTALLIKFFFGGEIVYGYVGKERHYWNLLDDGKEFDLTSDQYGGDGLHPVTEKRGFSYSNFQNKRFQKLWEKFMNEICSERKTFWFNS